jgi:hypothetical protein
MLTVRQLERFWTGQQYHRILCMCIELRQEASPRMSDALTGAIPAAAMAIVRLDELAQAHQPFFSQLVRTVLAAQEADGGWGEPMTTALCLRALLCCRGDGAAIDRGMEYLAGLQKDDGCWPRVPIRRLPADPFVSAFVLFHLAQQPRFIHAVRVGDAIEWFESHSDSLDADTQRLWRSVSTRLGRGQGKAVATWS